MRRFLLAAAALAAASSWAQGTHVPAPPPSGGLSSESGSLASIPQALLGEVLTVSITAAVGKPAEAPVWEAKDLKYTIPGSSVSVKMIGSEAAIMITVTPYKNKDGGLLLIAQGQVWYKDRDAGLRYRTTVDTLTVSYGERVLFYPFGASTESGAPLRVELIMDRYKPADASAPAIDHAEAGPAIAPKDSLLPPPKDGVIPPTKEKARP